MKPRRDLNLLEGNLTKTIIKLAWPIALGSVIQTLYNLADAFWLGKLGQEAISAPIISFFILFFILSLAIGFSVSGTTLVAQYIGAGNKEKAGYTTGNLMVCIVSMSIVLAAVALIFDKQLLTMLRTPASAFEQTRAYYRVMMYGMPLTYPIFVYQSVMNGFGDTISPLIINLSAALLNILLDPLLIFGWYGFPELGVEGAALASVITRGLASLVGLYLFFSGKVGIQLRLPHLKLNPEILRLMIKVGLPPAVGMSGASLGFMVLIGFVNQFGTAVVSAYGIGMRIVHFFMLPAMGISSAVNAVVGQNLGANNKMRARVAVKKGVGLMASFITPAVVLLMIFGKPLTALFVPNDFDVQEIGRQVFLITAPSLFFFGISTVLEGAFQGSGHTVPVMINGLARLWAFRIPFIYIIGFVIMDGPANPDAALAIWWSITVSTFLSMNIILIWFSTGTWLKKSLTKKAAEGVKDFVID